MIGARAVRPWGPPPRRNAVVLVAEEHEPTFELIRIVCQMEGIGVLRAMTTPAALALARVGQPDLILMDTCLADGTSTRAVRAIRGDETTRRIPIFSMSSRGTESRGTPCDGVFPKPMNPADLLGLLRRRLSGPSRPRAPRGRVCTRLRPR